MYHVVRNNQKFGPYSLQHLKQYVEEGKILLSDKAVDVNTNQEESVKHFLRTNNVSYSIKDKGSILEQIKFIGKDLLLPKKDFLTKEIIKDRRLIYLAAIGLLPAFLITFTFASQITFYVIALYFSAIWGLFFYYLFATKQVKTKETIIIFFLTQVTALILVNLQSFPPFSWLYGLTDSNFILFRLIGFVFGVGFTEETIKALPLIYLIYKTKEPIIPQTLVFYGLISGIGFGVLEGVIYQTGVNKELNYESAFFMNVARLTSLPFLHATWAAIAGYFLAFANILPRYRKGLIFIAIAVPAILHGIYDVFGWNLIGLATTILSVILLVFYLKKSSDYQAKLNQGN